VAASSDKQHAVGGVRDDGVPGEPVRDESQTHVGAVAFDEKRQATVDKSVCRQGNSEDEPGDGDICDSWPASAQPAQEGRGTRAGFLLAVIPVEVVLAAEKAQSQA